MNGWFRAHRGHAGDIHYRSRLKGWNIPQHLIFPEELREAVRSVLLCHAVSAHSVAIGAAGELSSLPTFLIYNILEFMHWDWFAELRRDDDEEEEEGVFTRLAQIRAAINGNPRLNNEPGGIDGWLMRYFLSQQNNDEGITMSDDDDYDDDEYDYDEGDDDDGEDES